ncbi:hypothetical protein [Candidatus Clostridium radicumherbarum]|uniref:Uncharacterized protein n=1 Tax=Candidatus Clostridium radicumherbarum TaxID=3381662 RepID=A0ABW8TRC7_9CLOT
MNVTELYRKQKPYIKKDEVGRTYEEAVLHAPGYVRFVQNAYRVRNKFFWR